MESEVATFCKQARTPMKGKGHQASHKTFDQQFYPDYKMCRDKDGVVIEEMANQLLDQLETHAMRDSPPVMVCVCLAQGVARLGGVALLE